MSTGSFGEGDGEAQGVGNIPEDAKARICDAIYLAVDLGRILTGQQQRDVAEILRLLRYVIKDW